MQRLLFLTITAALFAAPLITAVLVLPTLALRFGRFSCINEAHD
jgi:hypothetical protein